MKRNDMTFESGHIPCAAWHYPGNSSSVCIVMGHGLGATREAGLAPYAERFAQAGYQVLVFDYRHLGDSGGQPRQLVSVPRQLQDWAAAIEAARRLPGVHRIVLWGTSFSGGHVLTAATRDSNITAVIAQCPMLDGRAAFLVAARRAGLWKVIQVALLALLDALGSLLGRSPLLLPIAGRPGTLGFLTAPDSLPGYQALSPPGSINGLAARLALSTTNYRPVTQAAELQCPVLLQVCEQDTVAPPSAALATAAALGSWAEMCHYPIGHFDVYFGEHFERSVADQLAFLARHTA